MNHNYLYQNKLYYTPFVRKERFLFVVLFGAVYMHTKLTGPNYMDLPYIMECNST
jgi:hypothetical protein